MPGVRPDQAAPPPIPVPPEPIRYVPTDKAFRTVRDWLRGLGPVDSVLDVGCGSSPAVTWCAARRRYSIDPRHRPPLESVTAVIGLFPDDWTAPDHVSVVLCLDVLQDAHQPIKFATALLAIADRVIVSIPVTRGPNLEPVRDPVDRIEGWFGQRCRQHEFEPTAIPRLIAEFMRFRPVIGQRVMDDDGNAYTFEAWSKHGNRRYARVRDQRGRRHQLAERQLRSA
jgi:hypothetical protein